MKPDRNDPVFLAWCAGFFDGEGTVLIASNEDRHYCYKGEKRLRLTVRKRFYLGAAVYQTEREPLDMIQSQFGGSVHRMKTRVHMLQMSAVAAEEFYRAILPFSVVKAPEIDIALQFRDTFMRGTRSLTPAIQGEREALAKKLVEFRRKKYAANDV